MKLREKVTEMTAVILLCTEVCLAFDSPTTSDLNHCLSGYRLKEYNDFQITTCAICFSSVTKEILGLRPELINNTVYLVSSKFKYAVQSLKDRKHVCNEVLGGACSRWWDCCKEAKKCCDNQITSSDSVEGKCPMTWDGMICLPPTLAGSQTQTRCPSYIIGDETSDISEYAQSTCNEEGEWIPETKSKFITDFKPCYDVTAHIDILKSSIIANFVGYSVSITLVLISVIIFFILRNLNRDTTGRTNVHVFHTILFVAILCNGVVSIVWDAAIYWPSLTSMGLHKLPYYKKDTVDCKILNFLTLYSRSVVYWCMFCEGLYLYRRLTVIASYDSKKSFLQYICIGWGVPAIPGIAYIIARVVSGSKDCWMSKNEYFELIMYVPNIFSLFVNLIFLCHIARILTKMSNASESRFLVIKRTLRASFTLVPLFGLQMLFILYRPEGWWQYEILANFFISTQGLFVAIFYCFLNAEVRQELKARFQRYQRRQRSRSNISVSSSKTYSSRPSTMSTISNRSSRSESRSSRSTSRTSHSYHDAKEQHVYKLEESCTQVQEKLLSNENDSLVTENTSVL